MPSVVILLFIHFLIYNLYFFNLWNRDDKPGWVIDEFHETENMATFSIAMALLEFETTGLHSPSKVNVQTWADGDVIHRMSYINELASKSLKFFSKLFKKPHPLEKLDILILPNVDFEVEQSFGVIFMRYSTQHASRYISLKNHFKLKFRSMRDAVGSLALTFSY